MGVLPMSKRTVPQKVNKYIKNHPEAYKRLYATDMNEIVELKDIVDIVTTAFAYGYMKGQKAKEGGADK